MKRYLKIIIIISLFISRTAFASDINISKLLPATNDLKVGDEILIELDLLSEGVEYNAIEGTLLIPSVFDIKKVITGNSLVSVWLDNPSNFEDNKINFSGITPAGYNREVGPVFSVVLSSKNMGTGIIELKNAGVFVNDGQGTRKNIDEKSFKLSVRNVKSGETPYLVSVKDVTPPEEFKVELVKDTALNEGLFTIIWSAIDKGSGVKSYDVIEGSRVFKQVKSPYVLEKQSLNGKIYVKAYDYEGNIRTAVFVPPGKFCLGNSCFGRMHIIGVSIIAALIIYLVWRKKKPR